MQENKLNFVFFGTPDVASETLEILKSSGYLPSLIVTSPDRPAGRGLQMQSSPVAHFAEKNNIIYLKDNIENPSNFLDACILANVRQNRGSELLDLTNLEESELKIPDFFLVVAYGKILPEVIIKIPRLGSINIHYSLLPKYRGASPVESAILNGETETGVTIQQMEYKMDAGPIIAEEKVSIGDTETAPELRKRLIKIGGELLVKILPDFIESKIKPIPQDETLATFCKKIKKEDGLVDLGKEPARNLYNKFRAYASWPRTYFFKEDKRIIITDAVLEDNPFDSAQSKKFIIKKIIPEGGKEQEYKPSN